MHWDDNQGTELSYEIFDSAVIEALNDPDEAELASPRVTLGDIQALSYLRFGFHRSYLSSAEDMQIESPSHEMEWKQVLFHLNIWPFNFPELRKASEETKHGIRALVA